jgi:hypothetical protein
VIFFLMKDQNVKNSVCAATPGPKNRGSSSHWMLAFFVKHIYSRHKYVKSDALSSYRLVSFILLN